MFHVKLQKICPACGQHNEINEVMCQCMADISSVLPTEEMPAGKKIILRESRSSFELCLTSGDLIGRESNATKALSDKMTVSRSHARVIFEENTWKLMDLNSTNGTWVNNSRITPMTLSPLHHGDKVKFSRSCEVTVVS